MKQVFSRAKILYFYDNSLSSSPLFGTGESAVFSNMLIVTDPPQGRPVGGGGVHRK
jgi:hypothetical protein